MTHNEHQTTLLSYVLVGAIILEVAHGSPSPHIEEHPQACQVTSNQYAPLSGHLDVAYWPMRPRDQESASTLLEPGTFPTAVSSLGLASYLTGH